MKRNVKLFLKASGMQVRGRRLLCGIEEIGSEVEKEINGRIIISRRERQIESVSDR